MGQQSSREHAPLTFGYVNHAIDDNEDIIESLEHIDGNQKDFVLANPHLYQLQTICNKCNKMKAVNEVVVSLTGESCSKCQKQKRLSLVRKDLAEDLEYIDQTYYPDLVHYNNINNNNTEQDPMEKELMQFEKDNEDGSQQWSRLTIGEVTPGSTKRRPRRLTGPSMAVDLSARSLVKLSPSIGYLDSLTKLNL
jgi:DNA-binding TFAR19-related protein (PDSD5 family)